MRGYKTREVQDLNHPSEYQKDRRLVMALNGYLHNTGQEGICSEKQRAFQGNTERHRRRDSACIHTRVPRCFCGTTWWYNLTLTPARPDFSDNFSDIISKRAHPPGNPARLAGGKLTHQKSKGKIVGAEKADCADKRECFGKRNGKCIILREAYRQDGTCPFRKTEKEFQAGLKKDKSEGTGKTDKQPNGQQGVVCS